MKKISILTSGYLVAIIGLFFYSFTQIDLSLTLSRLSIWKEFEVVFQNIGYFQRPLSSYLFTFIVLSLFIFYLLILKAIKKKNIPKKSVWFLIILTTVILNFSYNAFSYDLFNYIFDAKIITHYQQNPYLHKALDFPNDPMLSFMHWTHRLYPYGPFWLFLTVPLSFIGFQFFLPTFFLFKTLMSVCFLGTVFFIGKILKKISEDKEAFGIAFFALNPLVVIESLVSSHNDIVMLFFAVWAIYLLMNRKYLRSILMIILSIGIKFATLFIVPIFPVVYFMSKKNKSIKWDRVFIAMALLMIVPIILASVRSNFQPWYFLYFLTFAALTSIEYYIFIPSIVISIIALFEYLPFLYTGNWDKPIPEILFIMTSSAIIVSLAFVSIRFIKLKYMKRQ